MPAEQHFAGNLPSTGCCTRRVEPVFDNSGLRPGVQEFADRQQLDGPPTDCWQRRTPAANRFIRERWATLLPRPAVVMPSPYATSFTVTRTAVTNAPLLVSYTIRCQRMRRANFSAREGRSEPMRSAVESNFGLTNDASAEIRPT